MYYDLTGGCVLGDGCTDDVVHLGDQVDQPLRLHAVWLGVAGRAEHRRLQDVKVDVHVDGPAQTVEYLLQVIDAVPAQAGLREVLVLGHVARPLPGDDHLLWCQRLLRCEPGRPVAEQCAHHHPVEGARRQGLRAVHVRMRVDPQHRQRVAVAGAGSGDRRDVDRAVTADSDHPVVDAGQGLPRQPLILHQHVERADPGDFLPAGFKHGHGHHRVGRNESGGAAGTGHEPQRPARCRALPLRYAQHSRHATTIRDAGDKIQILVTRGPRMAPYDNSKKRSAAIMWCRWGSRLSANDAPRGTS
jgi:hypothetical protein